MLKSRKIILKRWASFMQKDFLNANSLVYLEELQKIWENDPKSLHPSWQGYFLDMEKKSSEQKINKREVFSQKLEDSLEQEADKIVTEYRSLGHYQADVDPLKLSSGQIPVPQNIDIDTVITRLSAQRVYESPLKLTRKESGYKTIENNWNIKNLITFMRKVYCGKIGYQFMHIPDTKAREWIQSRIERKEPYILSREQKLDLLRRIEETHAFSSYCERKYSTAKRFGCEGLDAGVSGLNHLIAQTKNFNIKNVTVSMAHRGRLNVLACVLRKSYEQIFTEFEDIKFEGKKKKIEGFAGDVKYHMGSSTIVRFPDGRETFLCLLPNPSHLETVNSLLLGYTKALQSKNGENKEETLPIVIHGDAAVCGQGIIYELQQMELLRNYSVGGTIHIIFNNQVGFTTDPCDLRSSFYASNVASLNNNFVMHVNAQDPEAVDYAFQVALEFRMKFSRDVFIDLIGYRKAGHNEQDQGSFTQPEYYRCISKIKSLYDEYTEKLSNEGIISIQEAESNLQRIHQNLDEAHQRAKKGIVEVLDPSSDMWDAELPKSDSPTAISESLFKKTGEFITSLPSGDFHRSIKKIYEERQKSIDTGKDIDWALAESIAFGSLLAEGHSVRISGEDVERGTFSHRHAVVTDQSNYQKICLLKEYSDRFAGTRFTVFNSLLSEYGSMGFELGYSWAFPNDLVIWEGQFGDFSNGAQIIIDQYLTSSEKKWEKTSNFVLLLPHGYDGQGPEHSNARLERFLTAMDDDFLKIGNDPQAWSELEMQCNMRVCNFTSAANYFHALRQQVKGKLRKPMVVMSPKKLLRDRSVRSCKEDFTLGSFVKLFDDKEIENRKNVSVIACCSGQIYFELVKEREARGLTQQIALIRFEQLGPFPYAEFKKCLQSYSPSSRVMWISEEPMNFGAFNYVQNRADTILDSCGFGRIEYIGRPISSVTAVGKMSYHNKQHKEICEALFSLAKIGSFKN